MSALRRVVVGSLAVSGVLALAACGGAGGYGSDRPASGAAAPAGGGAVGLVSAQSAGLGPIVTDQAGFTLYRFDKDTAKPPKSNCAGDCATNWPPVTSAANPSLSGIDKALLGSVKRADGSMQLTLNGWALYRFAGDTAPGQTNGQGVGGIWFVVTPQGGKAATVTTTPTAESDSDYSY